MRSIRQCRSAWACSRPYPAPPERSDRDPVSSLAMPDWGHASDFDDVRSGRDRGVGETAYTRRRTDGARDRIEAAERAIADAGLERRTSNGLTWSVRSDFVVDVFASTSARRTTCESGRWGADGVGRDAPYLRPGDPGRQPRTCSTCSPLRGDAAQRDDRRPGEVHATQSLSRTSKCPSAGSRSPSLRHDHARHMLEYGTTEEQFGAVRCRAGATANLHPGAVMHDKTSRSTTTWLRRCSPTRYACSFCLISDGGAAFVRRRPSGRATLPEPPAVVLGVSEGFRLRRNGAAAARVHDARPRCSARSSGRDGRARAARRRRAHRVRPPFTVVQPHADRDMGFCPKGEAGSSWKATRSTTRRGAAVQPPTAG